jgi:hypothetical protein
MTATFQLVIDCADPEPLARFWVAALGYEFEPPSPSTARARLSSSVLYGTDRGASEPSNCVTWPDLSPGARRAAAALIEGRLTPSP